MSPSKPDGNPPATPSPAPLTVSREQRQRLLSAAAAQRNGERQDHGLVFQEGLAALLDLQVPEEYTHPVDAYGREIVGSAPQRVGYSFKSVGRRNAVPLGSFERASSISEDFYLVVGNWVGAKTSIRHIYALKIPASLWRSMFPPDPTPFSAASVFDGITNSRADDGAWKERRKALTRQWSEAAPYSPITLNPKRDHKNQRRVQCSISRSAFAPLFFFTYDAALTGRIADALGG